MTNICQPELLRQYVIQTQRKNMAEFSKKGMKLFATGVCPPPSGSGASNTQNLSKLVEKYLQKFNKSNNLSNLKQNINTQDTTKFLKYLA